MVLIVAFSSCNKTINDDGPAGYTLETCRAYDREFLDNMFPYSPYQTYNYENANGDRYTLKIDSVYYSEEHKFKYNIESCTPQGFIKATSKDSNAIGAYFGTALHHEPGRVVESLRIKWMNTYFYGLVSGYDDIGIMKPDTGRYHESLVLNNTTYQNVHEVISGDKADDVKILYIVIGKGVVGFVKDTTTYWLQ